MRFWGENYYILVLLAHRKKYRVFISKYIHIIKVIISVHSMKW